jgi:hypothetical protein
MARRGLIPTHSVQEGHHEHALLYDDGSNLVPHQLCSSQHILGTGGEATVRMMTVP